MHAASLFIALGALASSPLLAAARAIPDPASPNPPLATYFPTPSEDPFYTVPANIKKYPPGQVIRSRTVHTTEFGALVNARQLFYRTNDRAGDATGTVTTLFIPAVPASPPKILSYQSPEDALALRCNPSWANVNSSSEQESYFSDVLTPLVTLAMSNGYYVVNSDDEEITSSWLVGLTEGRATLDGIRAAINDLEISKSKPVTALLGYSGGAHETVWAASIAASYAPELKIVGAAHGGTPVDLGSNYVLLNGGSQAALAGGAIVGLSNGYPKLNATLNELLTPAGKAVFEELRTTDACIVEDGTAFAGYNFSSTKYFKGGDPMNNPVVAHIISGESLLMNVSYLPVPVPKFPRYEWHGEADSTVPFQPEAEYVAQQCAKGANIVFVRYPGLDHEEAAVVGLPGALGFIEQAFSNTLVRGKCGANSTAAAL